MRLHRDDPSTHSFTRLTRDLAHAPAAQELIRVHMRNWVGVLAGLIGAAQDQGSLPRIIDADDLAAVLVATADGLKDLGALIDSPARARRAYERRMNTLVTLVERLSS
ncbi:MAG: hypothetical protein JO152_00200 [Mycobacteriaceae bacterium]|nr:hypothetical protein [Mycobacteriaceae bacterium]